MTKNLLLLLLLNTTLLFGSSCLARQLGVIVWVDDHAAFNKSTYQNDLRHFTTTYPELQFETLYLKSDNEKTFDEKSEVLMAGLSSWDKISFIVLATHGSTNKKLNRTSLQKLGTFGADGTDGLLNKFFKNVSPHLSPKLRIVLESCSTYCGSKESVIERSRGLYNELAQYGVKELNLWGATQPMVSSQFDRRSYFGFIRTLNTKLAKVIVPAGVALSVLAKDPHLMIPFAGLAVVLNAGASMMYKASGTEGLELKMISDQDWIAQRDYYDSSMFHDVQCKAIFSK